MLYFNKMTDEIHECELCGARMHWDADLKCMICGMCGATDIKKSNGKHTEYIR